MAKTVVTFYAITGFHATQDVGNASWCAGLGRLLPFVEKDRGRVRAILHPGPTLLAKQRPTQHRLNSSYLELPLGSGQNAKVELRAEVARILRTGSETRRVLSYLLRSLILPLQLCSQFYISYSVG